MMNLFQTLDNNILMFIQTNLRTPFLDKIMPVFSKMGDAGIIWVVFSLLLIFSKEYRQKGLTIVMALILCVLLGNLTLKPIVARERPFGTGGEAVLLIESPTDYSFPSGHTMSSFAAATVIFSMSMPLGILAFIIASLIAFSRLYLFVHYPSDILMGIFLGVLCGAAAMKIITLAPRSRM